MAANGTDRHSIVSASLLIVHPSPKAARRTFVIGAAGFAFYVFGWWLYTSVSLPPAIFRPLVLALPIVLAMWLFGPAFLGLLIGTLAAVLWSRRRSR